MMCEARRMSDPRVPLRQLRDSLADRVDLVEVDDLFAAGEWHVGLEMLGDLVYEDDLALTADELRLADEAAAGWQDPAYRRAAQFAGASLRAAGPRGVDGRWPVRLLTVANFHSGTELREGLRRALDLQGWDAHAWGDAPTAAPALPHALDLRDWDVLRAALPAEARAFLLWLLAVGDDVKVAIRDCDDAAIEPADELKRL